MDLVALRNEDGTYCTIDGNGLFTFAEEADGTADLRLAFDRGHVVSENGVVKAVAEAHASRFAIRARDGATATLVAPDGRTLIAEQIRLGEGSCCCGLRVPKKDGEADLLWESGAHQAILEHAIAMLGSEHLGNIANARIFRDRFMSSSQFDLHLGYGLADADTHEPWIQPVVTLGGVTYGTYAYHFADPGTRQTYWWARTFRGFQDYSAFSEGQRFFSLAVHGGRRVLRLGKEAHPALLSSTGYYLGLALHFLTDLTQPMHAANFANLIGRDGMDLNPSDWRHQKFEEYAERWVKKGNLAKADYPSYSTIDSPREVYDHVGLLFLSAATTARSIWDDTLQFITAEKPATSADWRDDPRVDAVLARALLGAPALAATFLAYFVACCREDLEWDYGIRPMSWVKIIEPTKNEVLRDEGGSIRRWTDDGSDRRKVWIAFNADGSCSFGTKHDAGRPWRLVENVAKTAYLQSGDAGAHRDNRFRLAPFRTPAGARNWIFTNYPQKPGDPLGADEVVAIFNDSASNGLAGRWQPQLGPMRTGGTETQLFRFELIEPVGAEDGPRIAAATGSPVDMPWWGLTDQPPDWRQWGESEAQFPGKIDGIAAVSGASGMIDLFVVSRGTLHHAKYFGVWSRWESRGTPGVPLTGVITAFPIANRRDAVNVFVLGTDGVVYQFYFDGEWKWHAHGAPPSSPVTNLASCSQRNGMIDVFARTAGGKLYTTQWRPKWSGWKEVPAGAGAAIDPVLSAVSGWSGRLDVITTAGGRMRQIASDHFGNAWYYDVADLPAGYVPKAAVTTSWSHGRIDFMFLNDAMQLVHRGWTGSWSKWWAGGIPGPRFTGLASAATWGAYRIDLFAVAEDGRIWQATHQ